MKLSEIGEAEPAAPPSAPPTKLKLSQIETPEPPSQEGPGVLSRLWQGMLGNDTSKVGRFGMGVADPFYGGAQIGARMEQTPGGGVPEQPMVPSPPDRTKEVDTAVQKRERQYEQGEKKAGLTGGLSSEWARLLGNVAATAPLAVPAGGATLPGRLAMGAATGAAGASAMPVAGGDFGTEKAKQAGMGVAGGVAGTAVGEVASSLLGRAIATGDPNAVTDTFRRVVKPSRQDINTGPKLDQQDTRILTAVDQIINRGSPQADPKSLREFVDALDQNKKAIFQQYDSMAQSASATVAEQPNRHLAEFTGASRAAQEAQQRIAQAERAVTMASAQQSRAGNNVYASSSANEARQAAEAELSQARQAYDAAMQAKSGAKEKAYSVRVDTAPAARQLREAASDRLVTDFHPDVASKASRLARNLESEGTLTLTEAQDMIQSLNRELEGFYKNGQSAVGAKLAPVATTLREQLDKAIESAGGKGYQELKLQYGALRSVERDVAKAVQREANKIPGMEGRFADMVATEQFLHGVLHLDPSALATAATTRVAKNAVSYLNDPNRAIQRMFQQRRGTLMAAPGPIERRMISGINSMRPSLPRLGGMVGGEAVGEGFSSPPPAVR